MRALSLLCLAATLSLGCTRRATPTPTPTPPRVPSDATLDHSAPEPVLVSTSEGLDASQFPWFATMGDAGAPDDCVVATRQAEPVGRKAALTSLTLRRHGPKLALAWTVPPLFSHGGDDLAAVSIDVYSGTRGNVRVRDLSVSVLDAEEPSTARGLTRSPTNLWRVFTRTGSDATRITTGTDQLSRDDDGNELIECGDFSTPTASVADVTTDDVVARVIVRGAPFFARTAFDATQPFVIGLRTSDAAPPPGDSARFFVTREAAPPTSHAQDFWPLPIDGAAIARARNPASALRDAIPEGLEVVEVAGSGYVVAFRYRRKLHLGWLDLRLRPVGALHEVATLGGEPGRPRLAALDGAALLVVADREAAVDGGVARYRIYGSRVEFGTPPARLARIETGMDGTQDEFAPAITAMRDGRWFLLWSYGPTEVRTRAERQDIYGRALRRGLEPDSAALRITEASGSDPRAALIGEASGGNEIAVFWGEGAGLQRPIRSALVRCETRPQDAGR